MSTDGAARTRVLIDDTAQLLCATARAWDAGLRAMSARHPVGGHPERDGADALRDLPADLLVAVAHTAEALTEALALALRYRDGH